MLANSEVWIATVVFAALEFAAVLDVGKGRLVEISRAAEQAPDFFRDRILRLRRRDTSRERILRGKDGKLTVPSLGQFFCERAFELAGLSRMFLGVSLKLRVPRAFEFLATLDALTIVRERLIGHEER